jgi:hypothetical protein
VYVDTNVLEEHYAFFFRIKMEVPAKHTKLHMAATQQITS